ncbi:MAG: D-sedoheptulose 7-phosphate isomerase [Candidatus Alcyoniella australis]|nr:D-sedoheptulose 7-phosphate isomerase [Candidatus Alcyoniella australis]
MKELILTHAREGAQLRMRTLEAQAELIQRASQMIADALAAGNKVLICGNGGSAADAQHLAAEWVNRFELERPGMSAIALTIDASTMTSVSNDMGYERIFSRQIEALGRRGDVLIAISTSGSSPNVLLACEVARELGLSVIGLCGPAGSPLSALCDVAIEVPGGRTALIQEVHIAIGHLLCDISERLLFPRDAEHK